MHFLVGGKTYFVFATNGGSGIYALRLDGNPIVWLMECDGANIDEAFANLDAMVEDSLGQYRHNLPLHQSEREWFQQTLRGEMTIEAFKRKCDELDYWL